MTPPNHFTTINTLEGLFQYNRMPFGILSAPEVFHLLKRLAHVTAYLDDTVITGTAEEEHLHNLKEMLC